MHITINSFGTRGDVQPYIALGMGLKDAGHSVRVLTHAIFEPFVRAHGLDFYPIPLDPREVLLQEDFADVGANPVKFTRWLREKYKVLLAELFKVTYEAADGADLLLNSWFSFAGYHVSEKLHIPAIAANLQPASPTRAFPSMSSRPLPRWLPFIGMYNYLSTRFTNQLFLAMTRPLVNDCRADVLGLPPLSARYYWGVDIDPEVLFIYGYSPSVLPRPRDWGENIHVTGYWFLDQADGFEPPSALLDFLNSGPPPIYIGFGSMIDHEREEMTRLICEALAISGLRAILLGGWGDLGRSTVSENILRIDEVPHEWLFPKMSVVVHHGGAGTTAAGLRAGIPTVVIPFFADQYFWAWRVSELGVGPRAIPRKKLTAARFAAALTQAFSDDQMRQKAAALGQRIRAEDGVGQAVEFVEKHS